MIMEKFYDIHRLDKYFENKLDIIREDNDLSSRNKDIILKYLKDSEIGKTIRKGQKKQIGSGRNLQVAGFLMKMANEWFKKDLDKVTQEDMESFIYNLDKGKLFSRFNKPYSSEAKANIKKFIRKFYKYLICEGKFYPDLVDWIDTSHTINTIEAVPGLKEGVWRIVELIPDIKRKAMVWVCFDSGFREGELLNCSISDVEKGNDNIYSITCRYSKTKPRTVSLPYSSELLDRWLEIHPKKNDPNAQLLHSTRKMLYDCVVLYGKKALNRHITVHMLRHTSATHYAQLMDRMSFCKRYGWSYSSSTPDRYLDFAKISENKVVDVIKTDQYHEQKRELDNQKIQIASLMQSNQDLNNRLKEQQSYFDKYIQELLTEKVNSLLSKYSKEDLVKKDGGKK